jgi:WD40 repeat protein
MRKAQKQGQTPTRTGGFGEPRLDSTQEPVAVVEPEKEVYTVAFSPDGQTLATGGGLVDLWDLSNDFERPRLEGHINTIKSVVFSPNGRLLVSAGNDLVVRVWDLDARAIKHDFHAHTGPVCDIAFAPDGNLFASTSRDGSIRLWDASVPQDRRPLPVTGRGAPICVSFSPDGRTLALASVESAVAEIRPWSVADAKETAKLCWHRESLVSSLTFSPDGGLLAAASHSGSVIFLDPKMCPTARTIRRLTDSLTGCAFSPSRNQLVISGAHARSLKLVDIGTGEILQQLPGQRCASFSPDGRLIAMESSSMLFAVELWDLNARRSAAVMTGHKGHIHSAVFSNDGQWLATGSEDGTAKLWDVEDATERTTLRAHVGRIYQLAFAPDQKRLATAGADGTVKFWDVETGRSLITLPVAPSLVESIAFSPDGQLLATASRKAGGVRRVELWDAPRQASWLDAP